MAYDRHDENRRGGPDSFSQDRGRDRGWNQGGQNERGFFERAGEEIRSWFGDDDDHRRHPSDMDRQRYRSAGEGREDRERPGGGPLNWSGDGDRSSREMGRSGGRWRDHEEGRQHGGFDRTHRHDEERGYSPQRWTSSNEDYRSGAPRGEGRNYRPMAGDYGRSGGGFSRGGHGGDTQWDRDPYRSSSFAGSSERSNHDPHYDEWRRRQMDELDRDYQDYRREHQSKFESEFGGWREKRQQKRQMMGSVSEHMEVVGSDGEHVGTVDCVAGDRLILTKNDEAAGGKHHSLSCHDVERIEDNRVVLSQKADDARKHWRKEGHERALFEREGQGEDGPHMLDRSFSGTYRD